MELLLDMKCVATRRTSLGITADEIAIFQPQVPAWQTVQRASVDQLERSFAFKTYRQTLAFVQKVGVLAEAEDHHPTLTVEYGKVTVTWWTHTVKGLHRNDFIAAAKTDQLFAAD